MDIRRRSLILLQGASWGEDAQRMDEFRQWDLYPLVLELIHDLNVDALYKSAVHGSGHINRTLVLAGLIAYREDLNEEILRQYLMSVSYHDIGRTFDGLDLEHGKRSADSLPDLVPFEGELLREMQAAVTAHSQPDEKMDDIIASYEVSDRTKTRRIATLLKDADNLDRVRLCDFNPAYLRNETAKELSDFTNRLFLLDQNLKKFIKENM